MLSVISIGTLPNCVGKLPLNSNWVALWPLVLKRARAVLSRLVLVGCTSAVRLIIVLGGMVCHAGVVTVPR